MLETQALRECMSKARAAALAAMNDALAAMEAAQAGGSRRDYARADTVFHLSLIHISEPTRLLRISYAGLCLKKKKNHSCALTAP